MKALASLNWTLIVQLAALGLVRPLLSIVGLNGESLGTWFPILITALLTVIWVGVIATRTVPNPILSLSCVGGLYGAFSIVMMQFIWLIVPSAAQANFPSAAFIAIIVTNLAWGAALGIAALVIRRFIVRS
jgi:hypothetical protein